MFRGEILTVKAKCSVLKGGSRNYKVIHSPSERGGGWGGDAAERLEGEEQDGGEMCKGVTLRERQKNSETHC